MAVTQPASSPVDDVHLRCMVDPLFVDELRAEIMHRADITYAVLGDALQLNANCARLLVWRGARDNGRQEHR